MELQKGKKKKEFDLHFPTEPALPKASFFPKPNKERI